MAQREHPSDIRERHGHGIESYFMTLASVLLGVLFSFAGTAVKGCVENSCDASTWIRHFIILLTPVILWLEVWIHVKTQRWIPDAIDTVLVLLMTAGQISAIWLIDNRDEARFFFASMIFPAVGFVMLSRQAHKSRSVGWPDPQMALRMKTPNLIARIYVAAYCICFAIAGAAIRLNLVSNSSIVIFNLIFLISIFPYLALLQRRVVLASQ